MDFSIVLFVCFASLSDENMDANPTTTSSGTRSRYNDEFEFKTSGDGRRIAECKLCQQNNKTSHLKISDGNTTGLRKHLKSVHPNKFYELFPADAIRERNCKIAKTDEEFKDAVSDYVAAKCLPLNFYDDLASRIYYRRIGVKFRIPGRNAVRDLMFERYSVKKRDIMKQLKDNASKISFTIDGWTSVQNRSYYGVTAHFIDCNWSLQSLALAFIPSNGQHTGEAIAKLFVDMLKENELEDKLLGVTVDNAAANTTFMQHIQRQIPSFNHTDQHFRCVAHILNLAVQDFLKSLGIDSNDTNELSDHAIEENAEDEDEDDCGREGMTAVEKLRETVKRVRKSEQLQNQLMSACQTAGISFKVPLSDVKTRWNSTAEMIDCGVQLKSGLNLVTLSSPSLKNFRLLESEWQLLERVLKYLKLFKILSTKLGGDKYATLQMVVVSLNVLLDKIDKEIESFEGENELSLVEDSILIGLQSAKLKIIKHYNKCNWVYCAVMLLDPRHKMVTFDLTQWGRDIKTASCEKFQEIFKFYKESTESTESSEPTEIVIDTDLENDFEYLYEPSSSVDDYFSQARLPRDTNILQWWRDNTQKYPALSLMARDYLAIPATSVPAERLFSQAGLVVRAHRNKLLPESAEMLLCMNSWVKLDLEIE